MQLSFWLITCVRQLLTASLLPSELLAARHLGSDRGATLRHRDSLTELAGVAANRSL
jgi:hypothetical protein